MAIQVSGTTVIANDRTLFNTGNVGINTNSVTVAPLVGAANSFSGLYVSNGMVVNDTVLAGNYYIGTSYNAHMAGPITVTGFITVNGNFSVL
jgi:hypothetical protein